MNTLQIVLLALVAIVVIVVVVAVLLIQEAENKKRVLSAIKGGAKAAGDGPKKEDRNKTREQIARNLKESKQEEELGDKKKVTISLMLDRAGLQISVMQYWIFSAIAGLLLLGLMLLIGFNIIVQIAAAVIGFFGIPRLVVKILTDKRQKDFLTELPDALEATVRLLKAGMPVSEAVLMISKEYTGPVGDEMSRIYDRQKIGIALHEAAQEATKRMPLPEMQMFATGLAIQAQTGASLSEVLMNLANVIRARFKLKRKVAALSSEAIASAGIIGALPLFVTLGLYFANRDYIMILFTDSFGNLLLSGAVIWMCIGVFVMRAMINFKV